MKLMGSPGSINDELRVPKVNIPPGSTSLGRLTLMNLVRANENPGKLTLAFVLLLLMMDCQIGGTPDEAKG